MTELELRRHLRAAHFMRSISQDWPLTRLEQAHGFAHRSVRQPDHRHT